MKRSDVLKKLEKQYNVSLPATYKQWYLDNDVAKQFVGSDAAPPYIFELTDWAPECLEEGGVDFMLPDNVFVFFMHQGYEFCYFECNGDDDPPVWLWNEYDTKIPEIRWASFSAFLTHWFG